jgi:hypothetical protein
MKHIKLRMVFSILISLIILSTSLSATSTNLNQNIKNQFINQQANYTDLDPTVDVSVTVEIKQIRSLEKKDSGLIPIDKIDLFDDPDFYVKIFINDEEFRSPTWENTKYVYMPQWSATCNVPDEEEFVNITIQLWDENKQKDVLCDLSDNSGNFEENSDIDLIYSIKSGHWFGDDWIEYFWYGCDPSGYGRLNGCDDNSIYQNNLDCELLFDIYQNDYDNDRIPYWTELNAFNSDPTIDNTGEDIDGDGIPIEWEYKWGYFLDYDYRNNTWIHYWRYSPLIWEDHLNMDPDIDSLNNFEEFLTSKWHSDPFRRDLFIELDQMEGGPDGEPASLLPEGSKELLRTAYNKHNIYYHLDDGTWENTGSDMIPYDEETRISWGRQDSEINEIYNDYFLHGDQNNWRRGIFHYGVLIHGSSSAAGAIFGPNRFYITSRGHEKKSESIWLDRDIVYASAYMHETGHTLDISNPGVDDQNSKFPYQLNWWKWRPYKSVMNYGYMYQMVDYSDGSRGLNDFSDWDDLDLTFFEFDFP